MPDDLPSAVKEYRRMLAKLDEARRSGKAERVLECERSIAELEAKINALDESANKPGK